MIGLYGILAIVGITLVAVASVLYLYALATDAPRDVMVAAIAIGVVSIVVCLTTVGVRSHAWSEARERAVRSCYPYTIDRIDRHGGYVLGGRYEFKCANDVGVRVVRFR